MNLFRIVFLLISLAAVAGTTYVSWYGYGRASSDVSKSIRQGSAGPGGLAGRVK